MKTTTTPSRRNGFDHLIEAQGVAPFGFPVAPPDHKLPTLSGTTGSGSEHDAMPPVPTPQHLTDTGSGRRPSRMTPPAHASTASFLAASRYICMTDEHLLAEDAHLDASAIATEAESPDGTSLGGNDDTPQSPQTSDVAKDLRAQILRTPPERQIWAGAVDSKEPEATLDDDESRWLEYGPLPGNVSGIILKTRSGACIRLLNPDADLSMRWIWISGLTSHPGS